MLLLFVVHLSLALIAPQICFPWETIGLPFHAPYNLGTFGAVVTAETSHGTFNYTSWTRTPASAWALQLAPGDNVTIAPTLSSFRSVAESWSIIFWMNDTTDYEASATNASYRIATTAWAGAAASSGGVVLRRRRRANDSVPVIELCVDYTTEPLTRICASEPSNGLIDIEPGQWTRVAITAKRAPQHWSIFNVFIDDVATLQIWAGDLESFASHGEDLTFGGPTSGGGQGLLQLDDVAVLFDELATHATEASYYCGANGEPPTALPTLAPTRAQSSMPTPLPLPPPPFATSSTSTSPSTVPSPPPPSTGAATTANNDVTVIAIAAGVSLVCCVTIVLLGSFFVVRRHHTHRRRAAPPASRRTTAPASRAASAVHRVASTHASRRHSAALVNRDQYTLVLLIAGSSSGGSGGSSSIGSSSRSAAAAELVNTYDVVGGGKARGADYDATSIPIEAAYDTTTMPI